MNGINRSLIENQGLFERQTVNGKEHGFARFIQPDGSYMQGNYKEGRMVGTWNKYDPKGSLIEEFEEKSLE